MSAKKRRNREIEKQRNLKLFAQMSRRKAVNFCIGGKESMRGEEKGEAACMCE